MKIDIGAGGCLKAQIRLDVDRRGFVNFLGSAESLPFRDKVFEIAYCYHVLEHLEYPIRALKELNRISQKIEIKLPFLFYHHLERFDFKRLRLKWKYRLDREKTRTRLGIPFRIELVSRT